MKDEGRMRTQRGKHKREMRERGWEDGSREISKNSRAVKRFHLTVELDESFPGHITCLVNLFNNSDDN